MLQGDQSYMFWNRSLYKAQAESAGHRAVLGANNNSGRTSADGSSSLGSSHLGVPIQREITTASPLSSEESLLANGLGGKGKGDGEEELKCKWCGGDSFKAMERGANVRMVCGNCGEVV